MKTRWPLDGPEPPPTVRRIAIGRGGHHWAPRPWPGGASGRPVFRFDLDQWRRRPCRGRSRAIIFQCAPAHYHWTNADKSRPWDMLANRAEWSYAVDLDALRRVHPRRAKWRKRK